MQKPLWDCPKCANTELCVDGESNLVRYYVLTRRIYCENCDYEYFEEFNFIRNVDFYTLQELKLDENNMLVEDK